MYNIRETDNSLQFMHTREANRYGYILGKVPGHVGQGVSVYLVFRCIDFQSPCHALDHLKYTND